MPRHTLQPVELFASKPWGFSQVVISEPGRMVHVAGQIAWDAQGHVNAEGLEDQFRQALKNVFAALAAAHATPDDIQMLRIYVPGFRSGPDADVIAKGLVQAFGTADPPASTWVGVLALAQPEYLVEVEAMAVIPFEPRRAE